MTKTATPTYSLKTRTPEEVFQSHKEAIETLDFEKLAADYADNAVLLTMDAAFQGRDAIMTGFFQPMLAQFPDLKIKFERAAFEGDMCMLQWSAKASTIVVPTGTAVFIIRDGLIRRQGEWFQIVPVEE